jgi:CubicO group peptidase (beta-lactamase class C family)
MRSSRRSGICPRFPTSATDLDEAVRASVAWLRSAIGLVALCGAVAGPARISAQTIPEFTDTDRSARVAETAAVVESMFRAHAEREHLPGIAFGVVLDGDLVYSGAFGLANLEQGIPASPRTLFRIASMSKSFTAMAILQLRDAGQLSLDDPASDYVPELASLRLLTSDSPEITIRHLLTHSAGFPEDNPWGDRQLAESDEMLRELVAAGISFSNAPGITYEYSNLGFALLGQIVESVTGRSLPEYTSSEIFAPLGMSSTVWEFDRAAAEELARGYAWQDEAWVKVPLEHHGSFGAMGGLITSIEDFSSYVALHLSAWPPRSSPDNGPLRRSSLREMQQPWRFAGVMPDFRWPDGRSCPSARAYGYGLRWQEDCAGRVMVGHSGGLPGFGSNWVMLPDFGLAVISFDNRTYGGTSTINLAVADTVLALTALQPRRLAPTPILNQRRDELVAYLPNWNGAEAAGAFAENFFMDNRASDLAARDRSLFEKAGEIQAVGPVEPLNQLRGTFVLDGVRRDIEVYFTLSPEPEPKIQEVRTRLRPE